MTNRDLENEIIKQEAKRKADREASKMMAEVFLGIDLPEDLKTGIMISQALREVIDALYEHMGPRQLVSDNIDIDNAKKWLLFLATITAQINHFAENAPLTRNGDRSYDK